MIRSQQDSLSPSLDWSAIQSLFEETESDVLFLLDCCAMAASSTGGGQGVRNFYFGFFMMERNFLHLLLAVLGVTERKHAEIIVGD